MNTEQQQQRIMGYFIEEAKDHLNTIEQGVLNLQDVLLDTEMTNEMFRAAHSIKGGAAMLGVVSVQHISHRLEDYFKILQDHKNIQVDERLKSLFLAGFDRLQELIEQLETNYKISDELASSALESVKPVFIELESYLNGLVDKIDIGSTSTLISTFQVEVANKLRDMLQLFKQDENPFSRRELEDICSDLLVIGKNLNLDNWNELILTAKAAIAFEDNSYRSLALVIIKDTKSAQELVLAGRDTDISVSPELQALIPTTAPITAFGDEDDMTIFMDNISGLDSNDVSMDDLFADAGIEFDVDINPDFDELSSLFEIESAIAATETNDIFTETVDIDDSLELDSLFESAFEDGIATSDTGFDDFGLEDLLQDSIIENKTESSENEGSVDFTQDDDLGLEDFFSAADEDNLEAFESIDAGTWTGDATENSSGEFFDEFINEFSMVTEVTEISDDENQLDDFLSDLNDVTTDISPQGRDEISFDDLFVNSGDADTVTKDNEIDSAELNINEDLLVISNEFSELNFDEPVSSEESIIDFSEIDINDELFVVTDELSGLNFEEQVSIQENDVDFVEFSIIEDPVIVTNEFFSLDETPSIEENFVDFAEFSLNDELVVVTDEFSGLGLDEPVSEEQNAVDFPEFSVNEDLVAVSDEFTGLDEQVSEEQNAVDFPEFSVNEDLVVVSDEFSGLDLGERLSIEDNIVDFAEFSIDNEPLGGTDQFSDMVLDEIISSEEIASETMEENVVDFLEFNSIEEQAFVIDELSDLSSDEIIIDQLAENTFVEEDIATAEFNELETIIDAPSQLEDVAVFSSPSFDDLETLIELSPPIEVKKIATDDFDDLEELLRDSNEVGGIPTKIAKRPTPAKRQASKIISQTMKVDVKHLDSLNNLVGELVVNRNLLDQDQEKMQQFLANLLNQVQNLSDASQKMRDQYDRSLLEISLVATREQSRVSTALMQNRRDDEQRLKDTTSDFDSIELDRFSDFHALSQEIIELIVRVRESASDIEFVVGETEQVTRQLGVITSQVQDDLKQSRMVPFAQIADRLPRAVRDLAIKTGKEADIDIRGRETLIDKAILEQLYDPMTHLVSNALVHGLEDPNTRRDSGKQTKGMITVRAYHQGNQTIISVSDDGAGIDVDRVKRSAVNKGVRTQEEVNQLSDDEVFELLFEAGFSTKIQADEFAGRGVGLDVVSTALNDIRGTVFTESTLGGGTTFTIRLPLTLSISKATLCINNRTQIAFPVDGLEDMVEVPLNQVFTNEQGQSCLMWRNTTLPFQPLSNLLTYTRQVSRSSIYSKQDDDVICIVVLRNDTGYLALQVDQFVGEGATEIVIKQLEGPIPKPLGIAGATVLGDGRVMAIANVLELFDIASGRLKPTHMGAPLVPLAELDEDADPIVLIVDDSITVRELLSLTFSKVGYRVEQAKDGKDAWEKLRAGMQCNLIFCDIEMPKMNGLEFLARLQKDEFLSKIPVAMLTSRGGDTHRNSAKELGAKGYFTKPYLEEEIITASKRLLKGEALV